MKVEHLPGRMPEVRPETLELAADRDIALAASLDLSPDSSTVSGFESIRTAGSFLQTSLRRGFSAIRLPGTMGQEKQRW